MNQDLSVKLTKSELKVINLYVQGKDRKLISRELGIAPKTVSCHLDNAKRKIGKENLGTFSPRVISVQKSEKKTELEELKHVLENDRGLINMLYEAYAHTGATNKEKASAMGSSGVADFKMKVMSENGKTFQIMSKSKRNKILRIEADQRHRASAMLNAINAKPARISPEGDAVYIVSPSDLAKVLAAY